MLFSHINLPVFKCNPDHRYELSPGSVLVVYFGNILLADSTSDSQGGNGYFAFDIKLKDNLIPGDKISNFAYLHFDDNEPIISYFYPLKLR